MGASCIAKLALCPRRGVHVVIFSVFLVLSRSGSWAHRSFDRGMARSCRREWRVWRCVFCGREPLIALYKLRTIESEKQRCGCTKILHCVRVSLCSCSPFSGHLPRLRRQALASGRPQEDVPKFAKTTRTAANAGKTARLLKQEQNK